MPNPRASFASGRSEGTRYNSRRDNPDIEVIAPPRQYRAAFALLLSLLLVGMQHEGFRHELTHFRIAPAHQELSTPQADAPCAECALLAAGSAALTSDAPVFAASSAAHVAILPPPVAPAPTRPSFYRSRAPPSLS